MYTSMPPYSPSRLLCQSLHQCLPYQTLDSPHTSISKLGRSDTMHRRRILLVKVLQAREDFSLYAHSIIAYHTLSSNIAYDGPRPAPALDRSRGHAILVCFTTQKVRCTLCHPRILPGVSHRTGYHSKIARTLFFFLSSSFFLLSRFHQAWHLRRHARPFILQSVLNVTWILCLPCSVRLTMGSMYLGKACVASNNSTDCSYQKSGCQTCKENRYTDTSRMLSQV
jgi:hypothetical protein